MADKPLAATAASDANRESASALRIAKLPAPFFIQDLAACHVDFLGAWTDGGVDADDAAGNLQKACEIPRHAAAWETCPTMSWRTFR